MLAKNRPTYEAGIPFRGEISEMRKLLLSLVLYLICVALALFPKLAGPVLEGKRVIVLVPLTFFATYHLVFTAEKMERERWMRKSKNF